MRGQAPGHVGRPRRATRPTTTACDDERPGRSLIHEEKADDVEELLRIARPGRARVEAKCGADNLGPYGDFDWGMLHGKLSALRWVLGDEWDFLDT